MLVSVRVLLGVSCGDPGGGIARGAWSRAMVVQRIRNYIKTTNTDQTEQKWFDASCAGMLRRFADAFGVKQASNWPLDDVQLNTGKLP